VAALIHDRLRHDAVLEPGGRGEFTVSVDGKVVAEKSRTGFPADSSILESVRLALE
jgi:predicted Rdx family selenoprotein